MTRRTVLIKESTRQTYAALLLLQKIKAGAKYNVLLEKDDQYMEASFELLMSHEKIAIKDNVYTITDLGEKTLTLFRKRYTDFLRNFDVYSAVDLSAGVFAFEEYWKIDDENEWEAYLDEERWEDLRIAVCEYKQIDPVEIVFLSFISEGRLSKITETNDSGWQFDLITGSIWDEAAEIIATALRAEDLGYTTSDGTAVSGENVLLDIIKQGAELNRVLWRNEDAALIKDDPFSLPVDHKTYDRYRNNPGHKNSEWNEPFFD
ncbi:hypothetical protein COTS27_01648 [Spirochaetota bacterium]|nr:hypothetical protein COTS27_01648 [Spirochaetota bacterium]